jgi:hypothetical protein
MTVVYEYKCVCVCDDVFFTEIEFFGVMMLEQSSVNALPNNLGALSLFCLFCFAVVHAAIFNL